MLCYTLTLIIKQMQKFNRKLLTNKNESDIMENPHHEQMFLKGETNDKARTNLLRRPKRHRTHSGKETTCDIVISNNINNEHSPTCMVIPLTSQHKKPLPVHTVVKGCGLTATSVALTEQTTTINQTQLITFIGEITEEIMIRIELCLLTQLGIGAKR